MENCVILKWNPRISSFKYDDFVHIMNNFRSSRLNWSVWEYDKVEIGDKFFMVKVGEGTTGIVMSGRIASKPYRAEDWSGGGRKTYYCDLSIEWMSDINKAPVIPTGRLEESIPDYNWRTGHSGIVLGKSQADELKTLYKQFFQSLDAHDFDVYADFFYNEDDEIVMAKRQPADIETCIGMITYLQRGKRDFDGKPAIFHSLQVGMEGCFENEQIVGFLHDYVEDGGSWVDIFDAGVESGEIRALMLLTHDKKKVDYFNYIKNIIDSGNLLALRVKYRDLLNNLERGRAGNHLKQVAKHEKALAMLLAAYPWLEIRSL